MTVRQIGLYIFYFMIAFVVFAFVLFPREQAAKKISQGLGQIFPGIIIQMDRITPIFPLGIKCEAPVINLGNRFHLMPDDLVVKMPVSTIFKPGSEVIFSGTLFDGSIKGSVTDVSLTDNRFSGFELNLENIKASKVICRIQNADLDISFDVKGQYIFTEDKAKGNFILTQVNARIKDSIFNRMGITELDFSSIELDFLQDEKKISLVKCIAKGNVMILHLKGDLIPTGNMFDALGDWSIELKGFIQPQPAYISKFAGVSSMANLFKNNREQGLPIRITGLLKAPEIKL